MPASPPITALDQLKLVPLRNAKARTIEETPQRLVLEIDTVYPRWLGPLPALMGAKKHKRLGLDGMSLLVWRRLDDRSSLGELFDWLAAEQQLDFNEARLLMLVFLRNLSQKGLVVLGDRTGLG